MVVVPFLRNNPSAVVFSAIYIFRQKIPGKIFGAYLGFSLQAVFRLIQYKREGKQLHFHISRHIAHLGWETPVFFTLSTYGTVVSNCF
jgi:hypothetical protein